MRDLVTSQRKSLRRNLSPNPINLSKKLAQSLEQLEDRALMAGDAYEIFTTSYQSPQQIHHLTEETTSADQQNLVELASIGSSSDLNYIRDQYGFTGTGQTVAVIDSGIAWDHYALGGGFGSDYRVVGGWDFTEENDANPYDDGPAGFHGTHVAGIIGSSDQNYQGVAPGVDLVGLRVFNDQGAGYFHWVESALQWVHEHRFDFENPITTVNLSIGADWYGDSVPAWSTIEDELAQLKADGIFISVSAGNSFDPSLGTGLSYPAVSPSVVAAGSVGADGSLSDFSQRADKVLFAPGENITSTVPDYLFSFNGQTDDFASSSGTSMASPYLAGVSVLVREAMQFVGQTGITQDTIYDHLRSTADLVYDPLTGQTYHRINAKAAIDTLIPADDYGSNSETAFDLGQILETLQFQGIINSSTDQDYFTFTADQSGTITFTIDSDNTVGALVHDSSQSGTEISFSVTAGESYTIHLSGESFGDYQVDAQLEAAQAIAPVDWGIANFNQFQDEHFQGEAFYHLTASRSGLLAITPLLQQTENFQFEVYDQNNQLLELTTNDQGTVFFEAVAGQSYQIKVTSTYQGTLDYRVNNLIELSGSTVHLFDTAGATDFTFTAGTHFHTVNVGGDTFQFDSHQFQNFTFHGNSASNSALVTGTSGQERLTIRPDFATVSGSKYSLTFEGIEQFSFDGNGGYDRAVVYDSTGDDLFEGNVNFSRITGSGFDHQLTAVRNVLFIASSGYDQAIFTDSAGRDTFFSREGSSTLRGRHYYLSAIGTDSVTAHSVHGGYDRALFYDTAGDDIFTSRAGESSMVGSGISNRAVGFKRTYAYSRSGGTDQAVLYDSVGNDRYYGRENYSILTGGGYYHFAYNFDQVLAESTNGGIDRAWLYDSAGNDFFFGREQYSIMQGANFYNKASGFDMVTAKSIYGGNDQAFLFDSAGNDTYTRTARNTTLAGNNFSNSVSGFKTVRAYVTTGHDVAKFHHLSATDQLFGRGNVFQVTGRNYSYFIQGFDKVENVSTSRQGPTADVKAVDYLFSL